MQISVVICTYNRCRSLQRALESLIHLIVPPSLFWELIVVDNHSSDQTKEVVEAFAKKSDFPVIYIWEEIRGSSEARNAGIRQSQGEVISFLDDDVIVSPDWLAETWKAFTLLTAVCIGGKALLPPDLTFPRWWDHSYDGPIGKCDLGDQVMFNQTANLNIIGANVSFRRFVFDKYGFLSTKLSRRGNNLVMGEDSDFIRRLRAHGEYAAYYPKSIVYHVPSESRMRVSYMSRWYFRRGEWEWYATKDEPIGSGVVTWFGTPRWLYRSTLTSLGGAILSAFRLQVRQAVLQHMQFSFHLGSLVSFIRARPKTHERIGSSQRV
jgi:glycosyltransferase involved in cell wall biosynthesis